MFPCLLFAQAIAKKQFYEEILPKLCVNLEKLLNENPKGKKFFVGEKVIKYFAIKM